MLGQGLRRWPNIKTTLGLGGDGYESERPRLEKMADLTFTNNRLGVIYLPPGDWSVAVIII